MLFFSSVELSVFKVVHPSFLRSPLSYHSLLFISSFQTGAMLASVFFSNFFVENSWCKPPPPHWESLCKGRFHCEMSSSGQPAPSPDPENSHPGIQKSRKFSSRHPEIQQSQSRNPGFQTIRKPVKSLVSLSFPSPGSPETNLHEPQADGKQAPRSKKKRKKTIFCNFLLHFQASMG